MKNEKILKIITISFAIVFLVLFVLSIVYQKEIESNLGSNLENYGGLFLFFLAFIIELIPNYLSPHLGIINAYVLNINLKTTVLFLVLGSIIGSVLGFEVGKKYGAKLAKNFLGDKKIKMIEKRVNQKIRWGILLAAISPLPYLPIVLGSTKLLRKNFFFFGVIPRSIGIIIITLVVYAFKGL